MATKPPPQILDISQGGLIDVPPGVWTVPPYDKLPAKPLVIRGCGYGLSKLLLSQPLHLLGVSQWGIADVTIKGHGVFIDDKSNLGVMQNVIIADCEWAMQLRSCWDSHFYNCQFVRTRKPMVFHAGTTHGDNVNNHNFIGCRWEMSDDVMLVLEAWAIKNRFIAPKFHGRLPTAAVVNHVQLKGAFDNAFVGGNVTNGGRSGFEFSEDARDNSFGGMHVNGCRLWGFEGQVKLNDLTGVVFPTGRQGRNGSKGQGGNVQPQ